jgi:hypothetical protein
MIGGGKIAAGCWGGPSRQNLFRHPTRLCRFGSHLTPSVATSPKSNPESSVRSEDFVKLRGELGCVCPLSGHWETP